MTMHARIEEKLTKAFEPLELEIVNESHKHEGHAGHDGSGESHFRIRIVSPVFAGLTRVECQRMIYEILAQELSEQLHALSISASSS